MLSTCDDGMCRRLIVAEPQPSMLSSNLVIALWVVGESD